MNFGDASAPREMLSQFGCACRGDATDVMEFCL